MTTDGLRPLVSENKLTLNLSQPKKKRLIFDLLKIYEKKNFTFKIKKKKSKKHQIHSHWYCTHELCDSNIRSNFMEKTNFCEIDCIIIEMICFFIDEKLIPLNNPIEDEM